MLLSPPLWNAWEKPHRIYLNPSVIPSNLLFSWSNQHSKIRCSLYPPKNKEAAILTIEKLKQGQQFINFMPDCGCNKWRNNNLRRSLYLQVLLCTLSCRTPHLVAPTLPCFVFYFCLVPVRSQKPLLTVSFTSGDISLMNNYDDLSPILIRTGLKGVWASPW